MVHKMTARLMTVAGLVAGVMALAEPAAAVSFDCSRTQNSVERRICQNRELSDLDSQMDREYRSVSARIRPRSDVPFLRADQLRWLAKRNDCWTARCIKRAYLQRIETLESYAVIRDD